MNRRELLASSSATAASILVLGGAKAAPQVTPIRILTDLEHRLVREGMHVTSPTIISVQTQQTAFVEGDTVVWRTQVLVRLEDGTDHVIQDPEAMHLAWSQIMARQPGVNREVAYNQHWIRQIAKLT